MTITFYDIPSNLPERAWSHNTWKIRYALNYRNIPYKTEWIENPDIAAFSIKHGIKPTSPGNLYTLPAIHDPSTNTYLADSLAIAEYLEKAYPPSPSSPSLFPNNTHALQVTFSTAFNAATRDNGVRVFIVPAVYTRLNEASRAYFRKTREERLGGKRLEDAMPRPGSEEERVNWAKFKEVTGVLEGWYAKTDTEGEGGRARFLMGNTLSWTDLVVAADLVWLRIIWGEDSEKWHDIMTWHDGRWKNLIESLKKYETVV